MALDDAKFPIVHHVRPDGWHLLSAPVYRQEMRQRFALWQDVTQLPITA
jgi:hypothetical protein